MWNEGVSVSGAQARRGNGQCALSRNNSSLSKTKSPAHSRRPGGPSGTTTTPSLIALLSASFPPFTCSLVALLWLLLRRKRPNSRLTTRTRTGQRKPHRNIHLLMVIFGIIYFVYKIITYLNSFRNKTPLCAAQFCCEFVWNYYRLQK